MRILILGATGRTGKLILETAIDQGYQVNCLVRKSKKLKKINNSVTIFEGLPNRTRDLEKAIKNCDCLISALNISRKSDFPWSKLRTPPTLMSDTIRNVISIADRINLERIIVCSAWGVSETKKDIPFWFRWLIDYSKIGAAYEDHKRQEKILRSSDLKWTVVRPTGLMNSDKNKEIIETYDNSPKPKMTISRKDVAKFMVDAISDEHLIGKSPVIST